MTDRVSLHDQVLAIINDRMEDLAMTQVELGKRIGWTPKHTNRVLNGVAEPSLAALDFICHILGIELIVEIDDEENRRLNGR